MNNLILKMSLAFIKIGAFCFGGGYAAVGLIQNVIIEENAWLTNEQFMNIIAIAEMTPGPIAVNSSTFVGYLMSGPLAGILCTLCVILIPFLLALLTAFFFEKVKGYTYVQVAVKGIRPAAIAIIAAAGLKIGKSAFNAAEMGAAGSAAIQIGSYSFSLYAIPFFAIAAFIIFKLKKSPIIALLTCGVLGMIFYSIIL